MYAEDDRNRASQASSGLSPLAGVPRWLMLVPMRFKKMLATGALGLTLVFAGSACSPAEDPVDQQEDELEDSADQKEDELEEEADDLEDQVDELEEDIRENTP